MVHEGYGAGAVAGKLYPAKVTTNSQAGWNNRSLEELAAVFDPMRAVGMVLSVDGEHAHLEANETCLDAEATFINRTLLPGSKSCWST